MFSFYGFILWFLLGGIKSSRQHGTRAFLHMMEIILWKSISCGNEHIFHCVTSYNMKSKILGKQEVLKFSEKPQLWRDVMFVST